MDFCIERYVYIDGKLTSSCLALTIDSDMALELAYSCHIRFPRSDINVYKLSTMELIAAYKHSLPNFEHTIA